MEYTEKKALVNRIAAGVLYTTVEHRFKNIHVKFTDASLDISCQADLVYRNTYDSLVDSEDNYTLVQSYDKLIEQKIWSNKLENEFVQLPIDIKALTSQLDQYKFIKTQHRQIAKTLKVAKNRLSELTAIKNQLWGTTVEAMSEEAKRRFIIPEITELPKEDKNLLDIIPFVKKLASVYFIEQVPTQTQVRELARSEPFRLMWGIAKNTGTTLFPKSASEMTDLQQLLTSYAMLYDFVYESQNRPTNDIISDDAALDSWYEKEVSRINQGILDRNKENVYDKAIGQEMFIIADSEGASDVYNLNSQQSRQKIKQREKQIKEEGVVLEQNLKDIRADVGLELNRMRSNGITNRS